MNNRIAALLKHLSISSSSFAENIGVQRSSISHVLSGRNKPSLEFIQKVAANYPEINIDWLITGKGDIIKNSTNQTQESSQSSNVQVKPLNPTEGIRNTNKISSLENANYNKKSTVKSVKKLEKLILIYTDKTFEEIYPQD